MRAQKMREEAAKKEREEYFNIIWPIIPTKQEWRVSEKVDTLAPTTFDNDMDLLDDDEAPLIKDRSPPPTSMDISMVFMLPAKFRGIEEEVTQMCLGPKEAMFEKPEESSKHLKPLYIRGHIDGKPVSRMLIDGGTTINLMPYSVFKKLGREDNEFMKTNLMLNDVGGGATRWRPGVSSPWSSLWGASHSPLHSSSSRYNVTTVLFLAAIGFTPIAAFLLLYNNS
jgi:hypothetical protein